MRELMEACFARLGLWAVTHVRARVDGYNQGLNIAGYRIEQRTVGSKKYVRIVENQ
jgi:hypothetical protein